MPEERTPPSPEILARADFAPSLDDPLHGQVRRFLRATIEEHFEDGQTFWTERLLNERLGVARGTVRQALEALTREGILVRQAKSGSYVRKTTVLSVGVIFERANSDFGAEMMQQIAAGCIERGMQLNPYPLITGTSELIERIKGQPNAERLLLMAEGHGAAQNVPALLGALDYRVLSLDDVGQAHLDATDVPFVTTDGALAIRMAIEHLRELGHRRIVFFNNEPLNRPSVQRKVAEFERLSHRDGGFAGRLFNCDGAHSSFENAYNAMPALWNGHLWGEGTHPTAVFTASDPGAWAALRWFAEQRIAVPDQVSVLGYEGVKPDAFTNPPLSTVAHDFQTLAQRSLDLLWSAEPLSEWIAPRLVLRRSTAPPLPI